MFVTLMMVFKFLEASPASRNITEGEKLLNAKHLISCGITEKTANFIKILSLCLQTSSLTSAPHEITGRLKIMGKDIIEVDKMQCSCKAGLGEKCKHIAAVLLHCTRFDVSQMEQLSSTDTQCIWSKKKGASLSNYTAQPISDFGCISSYKPVKQLGEEKSAEMRNLMVKNLPSSSLAIHRANFLCFGLSPVAFHLTNIALHTVACILFTRVCLCVAGLKPPFATLAGLMFSVHPIHTEAVTGIVGRADVLACVFFLLSLLSYHGPSSEGRYHVWTSIILGAMSMMAKETGVTVFLLNLGYDLYLQWPNVKRTITEVRWNPESLEFSSRATKVLTSTGVLLAVRLAILQGSLPRFCEQDNPAAFHSSLYVRFLTFCYLAAFNLWLILCPATLSHDWQMGSVPLVISIGDTRNVVTCFFFGLVFFLAMRSIADFENLRHPPLILGLLLLVLPFLPASNLLLTVGFVVAERVLYIPSLGCILLVVYGIQILWNNCSKHRQTILCFVTLILVSSCLRTVIRNKDWKSRESLLRAGLQTLPHNAKMHYNYANFLRDSSRHELAKSHYYMALKLWPSYASAHNNLGTILKNNHEAEMHFLAAIKYASNHVNAHFNLGQLYRKNNKTVESEQMLKRCIHLEPSFTPAYLELARLRGPNHKTASGLLRKVVELNPDDPYYASKFGEWLSKKGNHLEALKFYWTSLRICATHRDSAIGVFRHFRKFGQKARMFQMLTRWHTLLRKKGTTLKQDFYLHEWQLKNELSYKIKEYSTSLHTKNFSSEARHPRNQKSQKRSKWTVQKNKTINPNEKNYKEKIELLRKKQRDGDENADQNTKTLDFSKFALLTYC